MTADVIWKRWTRPPCERNSIPNDDGCLVDWSDWEKEFVRKDSSRSSSDFGKLNKIFVDLIFLFKFSSIINSSKVKEFKVSFLALRFIKGEELEVSFEGKEASSSQPKEVW